MVHGKTERKTVMWNNFTNPSNYNNIVCVIQTRKVEKSWKYAPSPISTKIRRLFSLPGFQLQSTILKYCLRMQIQLFVIIENTKNVKSRSNNYNRTLRNNTSFFVYQQFETPPGDLHLFFLIQEQIRNRGKTLHTGD